MLKDSAQYVKGVGPQRFKILNRLGINTVGDLLYHFPRRYEDRRKFVPITKIEVGTYATVKGEILKTGLRRSKRGLSVFQIAIGDDSGIIEAVWFNQPFMKRYFKIGQEIILYGKVERYRQLQMNAPEFEFISRSESFLHMGRIVPVYPLTQNVNQRYLRTIIDRALQKYDSYLSDVLPGGLREKLNLLPMNLALRYIHYPQDFAQRDSAYQRLVFEEFFLLQMVLALHRRRRKEIELGIAHRAEGELVTRFLQSLPFELTAGQKKVIGEIEDDMRSKRAMNRLLQGDVGSGKTIVAAYALVINAQSGFQGAFMAPTEILAEQHYFLLSKLLMPLGVSVGMLISSMNQRSKAQVLEDIKSGALDIVVGTHALIEQAIEFTKLGLVVIDEQHKFGIQQRSLLRKKGFNPDCLVMTATPIPRTLAMTVYGDLDISTIREMPKGREPISTFAIRENDIKSAYAFVREEVKKGRQAYIVYPVIRKAKLAELKAATEMHERLKKDEFSLFNVGLIHGQMRSDEKEKVMREFKDKKIDVLVSTTVIEVGIDIANASVMVIEHAERFGLSQLHQLRGRIGRGPHPSYCILVTEPQTDKAKLRLEAMLSSQNGFELAQQDLDIRGPGKFFGPAQHGESELKIGNIARDMELMELARREAFGLVQCDPHLKASQNYALKRILSEKYGSAKINLLSA
ncbi:MAG: ATP-dependent DNA helicase RecG [Candidatus Omnitrophica bacterium]|nr:ATP-dependent DNA helicase RecG [Candidatus Omnitrophota bacterium]